MTVAQLEDVIGFLNVHRDLFYMLVLRREVSVRLLAVGSDPVGAAWRAGSVELAPRRPRAESGTTPASRRVRGTGRRPRLDHHRHRNRDRVWLALGQGPDAWLAATALMRALEHAVRIRPRTAR